jgi:putative nucleotidyltransferase with HDIG domain
MTDQGETLLIVDDEPGIRRLVRQRLSGEGYLCKEVDSAERALNMLETDSIALVVLDIRMPGRSGIELLPQIKSAFPDTSVIMATALDDYICKPFDLEELLLAVRKALEKRHLQLEIREYQLYLEERIEEQTGQLRKLFLSAIEALVSALEAKDEYTGGHSRRVTDIALAIGNELGLSAQEMENLRWGSLLHDIGKIAVDPAIQNKPGKLTREEYEHIMTHVGVGVDIVRPLVNEQITQMVEHHHDHYNGAGLHQTVVGDDIPLGARILAIADAFDAMISDRPYRSAMSMTKIVEEIKRCAGTQFDPIVVTAFLNTVGLTNK